MQVAPVVQIRQRNHKLYIRSLSTFNTHLLHALSSSLSDHCPLLLADDKGPRRPRTFKFENFWISMPGFMEVVNKAWNEPLEHSEPYQVLFHKLKKVALRLSEWSRGLFSKAKIHLQAALLVILHLDIAQEGRILSADERELRARLKRRVIALSVLERSRKKQCVRITNLRVGTQILNSSIAESPLGGEKTIFTGSRMIMVGSPRTVPKRN